MTSTRDTTPASTAVYDVICAYLHGEMSEGYLREVLRWMAGYGGDETRAAWFDAVERGMAHAERYAAWKQNWQGGGATQATHCLSERKESGSGSDSSATGGAEKK